MTVELDHLFICTARDAPEAHLLVAFGLLEGTPNTHPGQGTANRRFYFCNAMLELVWVRDEDETQSPLIAPTNLWERWRYRETGFSPFGVCVRPAAPGETLPFETWAYLPPGMQIDVATGTSGVEPLLFATPISRRPEAVAAGRRQPLDHPVGFAEVTGLRITLPENTSPSPAARALQREGPISFDFGEDHLAEIVFDYAAQGKRADFRPALPLRLRW